MCADMVFDPSGQGHGMATPRGLALLAETATVKRYLKASDAALELQPFSGSVESVAAAEGGGGGESALVLRCTMQRPSLLLLSLTPRTPS